MDISQFFKDAKKKVLTKNEVLHTSDEKCSSLGYIVSGRLVMKKYLPTGKELFLTEFYPGDMYAVSITALAETLDCTREALSRAVSLLERTGAVLREEGGIPICQNSCHIKKIPD